MYLSMVDFTTVLHLFIVSLAIVWAANIQTCHNSRDCTGTASCCRDTSGQALVENHGGFGGHFIGEPSSNKAGHCSTAVGKIGDVCDSNCQCGTGLECYRPMSGVCCPPMRCYNATWVQHQKEYWSKCMTNSNCFLPPRK